VAVELVDVNVPEAAGLVDVPADFVRHLVHDAEDVPACSLGEPDFVRFESAERVARKALLEHRASEQLDDAALERAQVVDSDVGDKAREQRTRMRDEEALAPVDPEQVGVPAIAGWWRVDERDRVPAERVEQPACAADDPGREPTPGTRLVPAV
jgi:hypothetical protein